MRNPIHKRLENMESWQHLTFMAALCERMYPNFGLYCSMTNQPQHAKIYQNILNLVWEYLTVKGAKINFEGQLEKLENAIPNADDFSGYGIQPALDACEGLSELLHAVIAGDTLEKAISISQLSLRTVATYMEVVFNHDYSDEELKESEEIQGELDVQWNIYRRLKEFEERNVEGILLLKEDLRLLNISNIGIEFNQ